MHENSGNSVIYYAHYTEGGVNKTGLTVTITVYEVIRDGTKTEVVTDGACTEIGDGLYRYLLASGTVDAAAEYVAVFHTATDTVDAQDIPAMWVIDRAGTEKLDTGITLADDAITAAKFDESTAYPLKSADTGSTQVARVGADSDTLETLSDQLDVVQTDLDNPAQYKADVSGLALEATLTAIKGAGWTTETLVTLKAYVDEIETRLTATRAGYLDKLNVTGTLAHSDAAATYKADVSGLAPANEYDARMTALQADLDNPDQYKADVSALATQESVNAIPTTPLLAANYTAPDNAGIGAIKTKTDQLTFTTLNKVDASATIDPTGLATSEALEIVDYKMDAVKAKTDQLAFSVPNRIDASATVDPTGIATSEELAALDDKIDSIKSKTDLMDASSITITPTVIGSKITVLRGDTFIADVAGLGSLAAYVTLDFTVKHSTNQSDDNAIIRIRKNADGLSDGLLRLNGAAYPTGGDGSLTITDEAAGDVMIMLKEDVTDDLLPGTYVYDIQLIEANEVSTLTSGTLIVSADVTRLVE